MTFKITCLHFFNAVCGVVGWLSETQVLEFGGFDGWGELRVLGGLLGHLRVCVLSVGARGS